MAPPHLGGVIPVAHTPFTPRGEIAWDELDAEVQWAFRCGADGVCTGMVSELLRLSAAERQALTERIAKVSGDRPFVASVGAESTREAVAFAEHAEQQGCAGVMAIPPISAQLTSSELAAYYEAIASAISIPVIVQDASSYVGQTIPLPLCLSLLEEFGSERILFKPETSPVGPAISALRQASEDKARCFDGSGGNLLIDNYRRGVCGTIPGMEFLPAVIAIWRALSRGDEVTAYKIYFPLCALVTLQLQAGLDGFLAIEKFILCKRGLFSSPTRRGPVGYYMDALTQAEVERLLVVLDQAVADDNSESPKH